MRSSFPPLPRWCLKRRWGQALKPGAETELDVGSLEAIAGEAPSASFRREEVVGVPLASLVAAAGLQPSKAAVRRLIKVPSPSCASPLFPLFPRPPSMGCLLASLLLFQPPPCASQGNRW